jgi:hypothetical protein
MSRYGVTPLVMLELTPDLHAPKISLDITSMHDSGSWAMV